MRISDWSSDVCSSDLQIDGRVERLTGRDFDVRLDAGALPVRSGDWVDRLALGQVHREMLVHPSIFERMGAAAGRLRSDEHTSELQSLMRIAFAVFCWKNKKGLGRSTTSTETDKISD